MKYISFILSMFLSTSAAGQSVQHWEMNLGAEVKWFSVAPNGMLIAAKVISNDSVSYTHLSGIDSATGKITWTFEPKTKDVIISGVDIFKGTNKLQLRDRPLTLLDPNDGRVLFESQNTFSSGVSTFGVIENTSTLWVESSDSARVFYLYDFEKQKLLWLNTIIFDGPGVANKISVGSNSFSSRKATAATLLYPPLIRKDDMIVATHQGIFKILLATGLVIWQVPLPDPAQSGPKIELNQSTIRLLKGENHFFFVKGQYIMALNYEDGKSAWINFVKTSGPVEYIYFNEKGIVLMPSLPDIKGVYGETRLNMVSEVTGASLWPQEISSKGSITHYALTSKGLAVSMKNSIDINTINIIDLATGNFFWPSLVKVSGQLQKLEAVPKGLLYVTLHTVNILDFDGNPTIDLPTQSVLGKPVLSFENEMKFYYYSAKTNSLYEIDKKEGVSKTVNREIVNFKGEEPDHIELLDDCILLFAKQNAVVFSSDGSVKFSVYRPSPSNLFAQLKKDVTTMVSSKKEPSTARTIPLTPADYIYIMTRNDQSVAMMVFDKNSGREIASVNFIANDDQPSYQIDKDKGVLYYAPKRKDYNGNFTRSGEIQCWKF